MTDFLQLPASEAEPIKHNISFNDNDIKIISFETRDEILLYKSLSQRLSLLENSLEMDEKELYSIQEETNNLLVSFGEKEELLQRIQGLHRLYEAKKAIESQSVTSKELAKRLRTRIAPAKIGHLKSDIRSKLDSLEDSLPSEKELVQISPEQELMEMARSENYKPFIHLGETGQKLVIQQILNEYGERASVEHVHEFSLRIDQTVKNLAKMKDAKELLNGLETLPIPAFLNLDEQQKTEVAEKLIEMSGWDTFASLNRIIILLNKLIPIEERKKIKEKNIILLNEGELAFSLEVKNTDSDSIQIFK
jgi:hypothetical protein